VKGVRRLGRDQRGGIAVLLAGSLFMLSGAATVAVDVGSVYLARRQLQGVADAAALAATNGGRPAADALLAQSGVANVRLLALESGYYASDKALSPEQRFLANDPRASANRIELQRAVPLFFARLLVGRDSIDVRARATAARADAAAFSIGSGLARIQDGVPNAILSALAGTQLSLSVMDYQGLASLDIDLLGFADALRLRLGRNGEAYGDLFDRSIPIADIVNAMADGASQGAAAAVLRTLAVKLPARTVRLSDIVDLGPMRGAADAQGQPDIVMDAFTVLRMVLSPPSGTSVPMDLRLTIPGLTSTRLMLITGNGQARSPMLTVTAARDVVLRTAQTRIHLETTVATALSGLLSVRIPLYVELAAAEARLSDINCAPGMGNGVTLAVTPSIGTAALADVDTTALTNFASAANPRPAALAQTLGTQITGSATIPLGGTQPRPVFFSTGDIAAKTVKSVSTGDLSQGLAAGITSRVNIQVSVLGIPVGTSPLAPAVGAVLGSAAPLIDGLLDSITGALGVKLGYADVRVHAMRCGMATLVG
jgi:uncharacterized membrane protein